MKKIIPIRKIFIIQKCRKISKNKRRTKKSENKKDGDDYCSIYAVLEKCLLNHINELVLPRGRLRACDISGS
jgi:hypothetical protein